MNIPDTYILLRRVLFGFLLSIQCVYAEFSMNFAPVNGGSIVTSNTNSDNGTDPDTGQTPYLIWDALQRPEVVVDPDNGNTYYHMIVGSLADGFIQESFVQMGFGNYGNTALGEPVDSASASGGTSTGAGDYNSVTTFGNGYDPLDMNANATAELVSSGNGTGNPTRAIMRQIISDGEIMMEFHKDKYLKKPKVSQIIFAPDIEVMFDIDMRAIDYSTDNADATIVNTMQLMGEDAPWDISKFDMSQNQLDDPRITGVQNSTVTGGKFTYADGTDFGGSEGTYSYTTGDFDQTAIDWAELFDPFESNPWNFESAKSP